MRVEIPKHFFEVGYSSESFPGVAVGLDKGANCQHFVYEILRHHNFKIDNYRSSELWSDNPCTKLVDELEPFDIVLFNSKAEAYGAHVGLFIGNNKIVHLCKKIGKPVVWDFNEFKDYDEYVCFVGAKRPMIKAYMEI